MLETVIEFFNQRTSGEQTLMMIGGGIAVFVLGIWIGQLAHGVLGS